MGRKGSLAKKKKRRLKEKAILNGTANPHKVKNAKK